MKSITFSQGKINGEERKEILEELSRKIKEQMVDLLSATMTHFLEQEVLAKLGRQHAQARVISSTPRLIDWYCRGCGCHDAQAFIRDGHYQRTLSTEWGYIPKLRVPMLECSWCRHDVKINWSILEKFNRWWFDLEQNMLRASALCQSLRQLADGCADILGGSVGLRTINERINALEPLIARSQAEPLKDVPAIIQFDGIWLRSQETTEEIKTDKAGRKRHVRHGGKDKRKVVLVALGLWSDGSGKREILDWEVATGETTEAWERLLNRLWERGVRAETGLTAIVRDGGTGLAEAINYVYGNSVTDQRCIFHKLDNVRKKSKLSEISEQERKELLREAREIYDADTAEQAQIRYEKWCEKWEGKAKEAVSSMKSGFPQTIVYYSLAPEVKKLVRTTSLLERTNRELRRKFRQVSGFSSDKGLRAGVFLQVNRLNARWAGRSWSSACRDLYFDLLAFRHP